MMQKQTPLPPPDSLAFELFHAATLVASVIKGGNLTVAYERLVAVDLASAAPAIREMSWGCLRAYGQGDAVLAHFIKKPLPVEIHALLLVSLYRLEDARTAQHTLVDQAVVAGGCIAFGLKGVVNGILRSTIRQRAEWPKWRAARLDAKFSHPGWWVKRISRQHPTAWEAILKAGNQHPPMSLRVNLRRTNVTAYITELDAAEFHVKQLANDALLLDRPVPVSRLPGFKEGRVSVQDAGAQWAALYLGARDGERVLDACAAPGGKTAHLLERADIDLTAVELAPERAARITENLARLGLAATVKQADCRALNEWWDGRPFDRILADVPCSASGVVRRHPDIKWLRREPDIRHFAAQQANIIDTLWRTLAPGGTMLYVTCSVFDEENHEQVERFLARHSDAKLSRPQDLEIDELLPTSEHDGFYYQLLEKGF